MDPRLAAFERLLNIMDELRAKCPWDQKQTLQSLRHLSIEEIYELSDAILENNPKEIAAELGDLFLHLVFYCKIGSESGDFDVSSVLNTICEKLIHRHPHIYGDIAVSNEEEVKANWEKLKMKEGKTSILQGVPVSLPALVKAYRIQEKVKGVGFDFPNAQEAWTKVQEELNELNAEILRENREKADIESEFGDLLFSLINYGRFLDINPEDALEKTNLKFIRRFKAMEAVAAKNEIPLWDLTLEQMDDIWNTVKQIEKK